jgi:hypothetical protein
MLNGGHAHLLSLNKNYFTLSHYSNSETKRKLISPCRSLLVAELHGLLGSLAGRLVSWMFLFLAGEASRQMYRKLCCMANHRITFRKTPQYRMRYAVMSTLCFVLKRNKLILYQNVEIFRKMHTTVLVFIPPAEGRAL